MDISESVEAILSRDQVMADLFYDIFLDRYPEVQKFFVGVALDRQATLLTMALKTIELHYRQGYPATEQYLKVLGKTHHVKGITPELYDKWCDCLIATLERFHGNEWDDQLLTEWREAVNCASRAMLDGYENPQLS